MKTQKLVEWCRKKNLKGMMNDFARHVERHNRNNNKNEMEILKLYK